MSSSSVTDGATPDVGVIPPVATPPTTDTETSVGVGVRADTPTYDTPGVDVVEGDSLDVGVERSRSREGSGDVDTHDGGGDQDEDGVRVLRASALGALSTRCEERPGVWIQFGIQPDGFIEAVELPEGLLIRELRDAIAGDLGVSPPSVVIRFRSIWAHPNKVRSTIGV